ncbi:TBC1 domain family member 9 [Caerostris extrusa]|uniref:TBC1 domain family member 9 n=1 Tax=Caerostris extrusa TaxID=172846 RepID=A0AAV4TU37_CAEEX|nr:TBC1 domain family member 9 [Caerostris extrusa]
MRKTKQQTSRRDRSPFFPIKTETEKTDISSGESLDLSIIPFLGIHETRAFEGFGYLFLLQEIRSILFFMEGPHQPLPFRIILHTSADKNPLIVASAFTKNEITDHWEWLEKNVVPTLGAFDNTDEMRNFVACKIESLVAQNPLIVLRILTACSTK